MKLCAEKPCKQCPWVRDSDVGGASIPNFDIELMRNLANTCPPKGTDEDGFRNVMACHDSKDGKEYVCAGYVSVHGLRNINFRLMVSMNNINVGKVLDNCEEFDLYDNFHEMLEDYEANHE